MFRWGIQKSQISYIKSYKKNKFDLMLPICLKNWISSSIVWPCGMQVLMGCVNCHRIFSKDQSAHSQCPKPTQKKSGTRDICASCLCLHPVKWGNSSPRKKSSVCCMDMKPPSTMKQSEWEHAFFFMEQYMKTRMAKYTIQPARGRSNRLTCPPFARMKALLRDYQPEKWRSRMHCAIPESKRHNDGIKEPPVMTMS